MKQYKTFIRHLQKLLAAKDGAFFDKAPLAVNGLAATELDRLVCRKVIKSSGAFFSSPELSEEVASRFISEKNRSDYIAIDPACGAGNLLLAAAWHLEVAPTLSKTLLNWGKKLGGSDIHSEFLEAAILRLSILARLRGAKFDLPESSDLGQFFPKMLQCSGAASYPPPSKGSAYLLMNPPFTSIEAPHNCSWAKGRINQAALFTLQHLENYPEGAKISAVLPDVLRSGSRYHKWRMLMESLVEIQSIRSMGNFKSADVDVFILDAIKKNSARTISGIWWSEPVRETLGDYFSVKVGALVKHRIKSHDRTVPYVHAKGLPLWGEIKSPCEIVPFSGTLEKPPFVVIRRTSSPSDRHRAPATIVTGKSSVAIDNHLIVCHPKAGGLKRCRELIRVLKSAQVNESLNHRIRCRHLTVGAVRNIPWVFT